LEDLSQPGGRPRAQFRQGGEQVVGDGLPREVPDDGADLVLHVEAQAVVDGEEMPGALLDQDVAALAVGVVGEKVEQHHAAEPVAVGLAEGEVVVFGVVLDELLQRAGAVGAILAQDGEGDDAPAQRLADQPGSHFAPRQAVLGEVPQRLLALLRFVHGRHLGPIVLHADQKGVVAAKHKLPFQLDLAGLEDSLQGFADLVAGHCCLATYC
jgi:hypothetical protein